MAKSNSVKPINNGYSKITNVNNNIKDEDREYVKNLWSFSMQVRAINTGRVTCEEEMADRIDKLFKLCEETGNIPTYEALALACGIPSRTFYDYTYRTDREGYRMYAQIINLAKEQIALIESGMVRDGKIPASVWTFRAKNYLHMKDVQEIKAVATQDSTIPDNKNDIMATLPEVPSTIELKSDEYEKVKTTIDYKE